MTHRTDGQGFVRLPATARWKSGEVPPPGPPMMNRARPARKKLAARVTMMSGTPDAVTMTPVSVDSATVTTSTRAPKARQAPRP